jgi:hypothetical protein
MAPGVLNAGSPNHDNQDIEDPEIAASEFRFGGGSVFGFKKPFRFFDLPTTRSKSPIIWLGIRSVSVGKRMSKKKSA